MGSLLDSEKIYKEITKDIQKKKLSNRNNNILNEEKLRDDAIKWKNSMDSILNVSS